MLEFEHVIVRISSIDAVYRPIKDGHDSWNIRMLVSGKDVSVYAKGDITRANALYSTIVESMKYADIPLDFDVVDDYRMN
jgi:hypothetical protein